MTVFGRLVGVCGPCGISACRDGFLIGVCGNDGTTSYTCGVAYVAAIPIDVDMDEDDASNASCLCGIRWDRARRPCLRRGLGFDARAGRTSADISTKTTRLGSGSRAGRTSTAAPAWALLRHVDAPRGREGRKVARRGSRPRKLRR